MKNCCQSHHNMVYDAEMNGYYCKVCGSNDEITTDNALPSIEETAIKLYFLSHADKFGVPQENWIGFLRFCEEISKPKLLPGESVCPECDHIFHVSCGCCSIVGTDLVEAIVQDIEELPEMPPIEECLDILQRIKTSLAYNDRSHYPVKYSSEEERLQMEAIEKELKS